MALPTDETLRELADWQPRHGVLSIYAAIDPADRGEGWRIDLRNQLKELEAPPDRDAVRPLEATVRRVLDRFPPDAPLPSGLTQVGFVEIAAKPAREAWFALQMRSARTVADRAARPLLGPLLRMLDDGAPRGIAAISTERVRLLRWELGWLEELADWEIELFSLDWRERKAQRPGDPARVQGVASSGRDQFGQRLEHNRERFLKETGRLAANRVEPASAELLVFGDAEHAREFAAGAGERVRHAGEANLVTAPLAEVEAAVGEAIRALNRDRKADLAHRILEEAAGGGHGAAGSEETLQALGEGRVEHLVYDPGAESGWKLPDGDGRRPSERLIDLALATSARVTTAEGPAAEALAEVGGVAALLRY